MRGDVGGVKHVKRRKVASASVGCGVQAAGTGQMGLGRRYAREPLERLVVA